MSQSRKVMSALGLLALGVGVAVGVVLLQRQGLDRASLWVTVVGFFVSTLLGVTGLVLGWVTLRRTSSPAPASAPPGQTVSNVTTGSGVDQISDVAGSVHLGVTPPQLPTAPPVSPHARTTTPPPPAGQSVTDTQVGGGIRQVRGVGGDVEIGQ